MYGGEVRNRLEMVLGLLLAAGAVGLAGYGMGKHKERREVANGYITYHENGHNTTPYGNIHYGNTGHHYGGRYHQQTVAAGTYYPGTGRY